MLLFNPKSVIKHIFLPLYLIMSLTSSAQTKEQLPLIKSIERYCVDSLQPKGALVSIDYKMKRWNEAYNETGWILDEDKEHLIVLTLKGYRSSILKKYLVKRTVLKSDFEIIGKLTSDRFGRSDWNHAAKNYYLALWAYKSKKHRLAEKALSILNISDQTNDAVKTLFGHLYFNRMLEAYSHARDYREVIYYGMYLAQPQFEGFEYRSQAIALANQLKGRPDDFKTFCLPDSAAWEQLKITMNRKEQLNYLLDRLHLLNCIQNGQPAFIDYSDDQSSISQDSFRILFDQPWQRRREYKVINPYTEILQMKLAPAEVEIIVPCIADTSFIPTYSYFRDFRTQRHLETYQEVIENILFKITNKRMYEYRPDGLPQKIVQNRIDSFMTWCKKNEGLTNYK